MDQQLILLRRIANKDKRVAVILRTTRTAMEEWNGVGLDTPRAWLKLLNSLRMSGYQVEPCPLDGAELMTMVCSPE